MVIDYKERRLWKGLLLVFALVIGIASLLYTNLLVQKLVNEEEKKVKLWADAQLKIVNSNQETGDITFTFEVIRQNETIPAILVNENNEIISYKNLDTNKVKRPGYLQSQLQSMMDERDPIIIPGNKHKIYYKDSDIVIQLRYYPYVQLFMICVFFVVAYMAFSSTRKYEQNRVWVGMSKETAHQLGTPLSSLMGWVEYLKMSGSNLPENVVNELEKDITRLQTVTERFSKIGSTPKLEKRNVYNTIMHSIQYLRTRFSKKVSIGIDESSDNFVKAEINESLFDWVIENLVKNAVNAIENEGKIIFKIKDIGNWIQIDVIDTGKGIPRSDFANVFRPGYTTRRRGWGLGLSLVKRIIENYHNGNIYIKSSEIGKGTTFRIKLKK